MPGTTPNRGYPFPHDSDQIDVAGDIEKLAVAIDADVSGTNGLQEQINFVHDQLDRNTALDEISKTFQQEQINTLHTWVTNLYGNGMTASALVTPLQLDANGQVLVTFPAYPPFAPGSLPVVVVQGNPHLDAENTDLWLEGRVIGIDHLSFRTKWIDQMTRLPCDNWIITMHYIVHGQLNPANIP